MKALSIIGYHHSGKTTTATTLIPLLIRMDYKVSSIKDIHNEDYQADTAGTNSWKHRQAGSQRVFARGLNDSALIFDRPLSFQEMLHHLQADFLIIEGMKEVPLPQILCITRNRDLMELISDLTVAIVVYPELCTEGSLLKMKSFRDVPVIHLPSDAKELLTIAISKGMEPLPMVDPECCSECGMSCDELMRAIISDKRKRSDCRMDSAESISIKVDGKSLPVVPFIQRLLKDQINAFIYNLKGGENAGKIEITIKRDND